MTEERKYAILFAATMWLARKLMPMLEQDTPDFQIEGFRLSLRMLCHVHPSRFSSGQNGGVMPV